MLTKTSKKEKAIKLRKDGKSYSDILKIVPVAKSTLSQWLRDVGLSKIQKQKLSSKKLASALRGAQMRKTQRMVRSHVIMSEANSQIGKISEREIFLMGVALYWAEGSKQKEHNVSQGTVFANSDLNMIKCFLNWLKLIGVQKEDITFELYVHVGDEVDRIVLFWSKNLDVSVDTLKEKVYFKKGNKKTLRKNVGEKYFGLIRIRIKKSTDINRKIQGWIQGILQNWLR